MKDWEADSLIFSWMSFKIHRSLNGITLSFYTITRWREIKRIWSLEMANKPSIDGGTETTNS